MKRSRSSHPFTEAAFSPGLRRLAWLNIAVQAAFPLAVAFTPVMAGAGEQHFLQQPAPLSAQRTQVYTLGAGETAASVAKKFHLTLEQLREMNAFRTFARGLNGLQPGDDVDVPLIRANDKKQFQAYPRHPHLLTTHPLPRRRVMNRRRRWPATPHGPEASWPAAQKVTRLPPWPGAWPRVRQAGPFSSG